MTQRVPFFERFRRFWRRHRTLFWTVHSLWALATGVFVVVLAHERYGFAPWVLGFLGVTWLSTMFFARRPAGPAELDTPAEAPPLGEEVTSYVTRTLYQETLFFLLPFYAYSTVLSSPNVVFLGGLGVLALGSCLDLPFDRLLRTSVVFGMVFFATVAYAAVNLILPMVTGIDPEVASPVAAVAAVASALPLALRGAHGMKDRLRLAVASAAILFGGFALTRFVPPAPLRLESGTFAAAIDRETLALADTLWDGVDSADLTGPVIVLVEVFAPANVPTTVTLEWRHDGTLFRTTGEVEIVAHEGGFRVWDSWRPEAEHAPAGEYEVTLKTGKGRVFGVATLQVDPSPPRSPWGS